ncbi:hypothetical protein OC846_000687 [Tilletia horrida]|uniref:Ubiquitin carboxyl-terminal hydrolase n=1 Tax=Tilletia horrida TaxID=155126 RepID=A0AAN6GX93_9BASI|nr:hypothetical protein OC846_000687 [Tilletia horrida]
MSFSWKGIFHNSKDQHPARAGSGSAAPPLPPSSGRAGGSHKNGSLAAAGSSTASTSRRPHSAAGLANAGLGLTTHGLAGTSALQIPPHASNGDAAAAASPNRGGMVARLRIWEQLERPDVPLLGLENFGNTCYANSVIQALYHCPPFRESILRHMDESQRPKAISAEPQKVTTPHALQDLFAQMTEQSIATVQALNAAAVAQAAAAASPTSSGGGGVFSTKRAFGGLSMGGLGGGPPVPISPAATTGTGFSMGSSATSGSLGSSGGANGIGNASSSLAAPATSGALVGGTTGKNDGHSKRAVDQAVIKAFLAAFRKENVLFDSTMHQDAHEMLNFLLNRVGEELVDGSDEPKATGSSASPAIGSIASASSGSASRTDAVKVEGLEGRTCVHRLFEGKLTNETKCLTCETVSSRDESFLDLSIDIEPNSSVTSCLRQFSASETLRSRNKFFCDTCSGLQEAEKRMKVKQLPNVLALHLKRFKYEESAQKYIKLAYRVVFPMQLRLFNTSDVATNPDRLYTLFAIVVHIGAGLHHGHYIAIVKVGSRWVCFDDDTVETIDEMDIAKYFGDTPGTGSAYVLFYQAEDLDREALGLSTVPSAGSSSTVSLPTVAVAPTPSGPIGNATALLSSSNSSTPVQRISQLPPIPQAAKTTGPPSSPTPPARAPGPELATPPQRPTSAADLFERSSPFNSILKRPRPRTPSPGDLSGSIERSPNLSNGANNSTPPSRMGTLLGSHRRNAAAAARQATLPLSVEAQIGLGTDPASSSAPPAASDRGGKRIASGVESPAPKGGRRSLVGRFGFGKSSANQQ